VLKGLPLTTAPFHKNDAFLPLSEHSSTELGMDVNNIMKFLLSDLSSIKPT
jgi:hypothetical protein